MALFRRKAIPALELPYREISVMSIESVTRTGDYPHDGRAAWRSLSPFYQKQMVGVPFGPGVGLEEAVACSGPSFDLAGAERFRFNAKSTAGMLHRDIGMREASFDDWDNVCGNQRDVFGRYGLPFSAFKGCLEELMQVKTTLGDIVNEQGEVFRRWQKDDAYAVRLWAWWAVIHNRLGSTGKTFYYAPDGDS